MLMSLEMECASEVLEERVMDSNDLEQERGALGWLMRCNVESYAVSSVHLFTSSRLARVDRQ